MSESLNPANLDSPASSIARRTGVPSFMSQTHRSSGARPSHRAQEVCVRCASASGASSKETVAIAALIAATLGAGVLLVALVTRVALASQARGWLYYTFPGVPHRLGSATWIFANNGRELLGVLGLLLIAQLGVRRADGPTRAQQLIRAGGEMLLTGAVAANALVIGAAVGAYGERMVRSMLPHGPVEVAAYALALALYLQGRRRPLPAARLAGTIAVSVVLLAAAALLETFR